MSRVPTASRVSPLAPLLALLLLVAPAAPAAERILPPRGELDACLGPGFSMEEQIARSYTAEELGALDRALAAWDMGRVDLTFRKDYAEGKGSFPLVLDMMKHPLHIAPVMDGFAASIAAAGEDPRFAVPELLAAARVHPGLRPAAIPGAEEIARESSAAPLPAPGPGRRMPPRPFLDLLRRIAAAEAHARKAVAGIPPEDLRLLRQGLPATLLWHDVVESPYPEAEAKALAERLKAEKNDAWLDERAGLLDLQEMLLAWVALPRPEDVREKIPASAFPKDRPLVLETAWGRLGIGTMGNDTWTGDFAILIEPGGDDTYRDCRIGAAWGLEGSRVGWFADLGGRDRYACAGRNVTMGAAVLGVAAFYDLGGDPDLYDSGHLSQGAAAGGIATFVDEGGADRYTAKVFAQGAAGYGIGILADRAPAPAGGAGSPANAEDAEVPEETIQNNRFDAWVMAQGFSRQWGVGLCHGARGNDLYHAGGVYLHAPLFNDRYQSFSQGFSIGSRNIDTAGGLAFLVDEGGNDTYLGDIYNQGVGYWYAAGLLHDRGGNDRYEMTQYGQGSGIHLAIGGLIDEGGNDSYVMESGLGQGGSHDFAASVFMDRGGMDRYMGSTSCNGTGLTNSVGLFFERSGNDIYGADPTAQSLGGGRWDRATGSIGVFVDTGGTDWYLGEGKDGALWTQNLFGAGLDLQPAGESGASGATTAQADRPAEESKIEIPEVCSREGPLTDELFDELWAIAVRWEVGDNRVIVPKARERIVAFGLPVLPKVDARFDDTSGLAGRAYEAVVTALGKEHPREVREMLVRNLRSPEVPRQRNALSVIGSLKMKELGSEVAPLLESEKVRTLAITTLGSIGSDAGNVRLRGFLAPDQGERLIVSAAQALLALGQDGIYPQLRALLAHELFTVRAGIIGLLAANRGRFEARILEDLEGGALDRRTRIGLLRAIAGGGGSVPSGALARAAARSLGSADPVERAFAVQALRSWLEPADPGWEALQRGVRRRLDARREAETDPFVLRLLEKAPE